MRLTFVGADHEVTGSCHYLEAAGKKILIDYGLEQGRDDYANIDLPVDPADLDYVFLTHAHIDHSGNLPLLPSRGFSGEIFATKGTNKLCNIMLLDSAHIQEFEAEWRNRKGERQGKDAYVPPYTTADAKAVLELFHPCEYKEIVEVAEGLKIRFNDVGHLFGSAAIEIWCEEDGKETKIVFSGDIGNVDQPLIKDPGTISEADYVVIESTYGDRSHEQRVDYVTEISKVLKRTFDRGGNVVIPSFAVGRTQEMLYFFRKIKSDRLVEGYDDFKVYVDSPLAIKATTIFTENYTDCYDEEALALVTQGINPITFPGLVLAETTDESKAINEITEPIVIISSSGMCEAGRIKHHLKHNLWRPESTILFVGYQAEGSLGRLLLDGRKDVKLFGESINVAAEIYQLPGVSGHADREGLLRWAEAFGNTPRKFFVVHGDAEVVDPFAALITEKTGIESYAPFSGTVFDLTNNVLEYEAEPVPIEEKPKQTPTKLSGARLEPGFGDVYRRSSPAYKALRDAENRLAALVKKSDGLANKDLKKLTDAIDALVTEWET